MDSLDEQKAKIKNNNSNNNNKQQRFNTLDPDLAGLFFVCLLDDLSSRFWCVLIVWNALVPLTAKPIGQKADLHFWTHVVLMEGEDSPHFLLSMSTVLSTIKLDSVCLSVSLLLSSLSSPPPPLRLSPFSSILR